MALIRAVATEFPNTMHNGCYFHQTQAIIRKVKKRKFYNAYRDKVITQLCIRKLMTLGFLQPNCFRPAFERLALISPKSLNPIFQYYEDFWINKIGVDMFSVYNRKH